MAITHGRNNSLVALIDQLENMIQRVLFMKRTVYFYVIFTSENELWRNNFTLKSNTLQMLFKRWFVFEGIYNSAESKDSCYRKYRLDQMPNFVKRISFSRTDHVLTK